MDTEEEESSIEERQFILCAMGHGIMTLDYALDSFLKCKDESQESTVDEMDSLIKRINRKISDFDQKIEKIRYEPTNTIYYVFINTSESLLNRFQSHFAQPDLHYFRLLVKAIALSDTDCSINGFEPLNICSQVNPKPITKVHGEKLLEEWIRMGYFHREDGLIMFGPRMIVEFSHYLQTNYPNNIHTCKLCKQIAVGGAKCYECEEDFHRECIRKYLIRGANCPECKKPWKSSVDDLNSQEEL